MRKFTLSLTAALLTAGLAGCGSSSFGAANSADDDALLVASAPTSSPVAPAPAPTATADPYVEDDYPTPTEITADMSDYDVLRYSFEHIDPENQATYCGLYNSDDRFDAVASVREAGKDHGVTLVLADRVLHYECTGHSTGVGM